MLVIDVSLLGPPRVERDGTLVTFDTRKALALLAVLAVAEGPRTRDALADLLWPGADPEHARGAFRRTLSALRTAVGGELLEANHDHVRLVKGDTITVDVDRFRQLCRRGDPEAAVALFRGDFLEGFVVRHAPEFESWAQLEGDGLRRELTAALAAVTRTRQAAGDAAGAVQAARRWLSIDALHEPAHQALIRLYAETGNRAAALTQYRECARALSRELGVPPLTQTTELYEAILEGAYPSALPVLEVADPGPATPAEQPGPPLVGRAADLADAQSVYDAVGPDGRILLVEGEAGIGKTRLVEEVVGSVRHRGGRVLVGRAYEDEVGLAYAPVVEALRIRLREGVDWLADLDDRTLAEVARLVPELGAMRSFDPPAPLEWPGAETRFLSAVWQMLLAAVAGDMPGTLFLDDVHWADDATMGLLTYGLRRLHGRPVLVVLAWRTPQDHPFRRTVTAVTRSGEGAVIHLGRLDEEDVESLMRSRSGAEDLTGAHRLWRRTEGVPLLLVEYLRAGDLGVDDALPVAVRDLLRGRVDPLSETAHQILSSASVLGRSFGVDTVRAVSGRTDEETVSALEELVAHGLVVERGFDYDFAHDLLREVVYQDASLARRRLLHGRAARIPDTPAASVARHLQLAGRDREAAAAFREAGVRAREVFANGEALDHFRSALALGHPDRTDLLAAIADLQVAVGEYRAALVTLETAAASCTSDERSAVEERLGRLQHRRGEFASAEVYLTAALEGTPDGDPGRRARITADLGHAVHSQGDLPRAELLAREATTLARHAGDPRALCQAHNLLGMLALARGDTDSALDTLHQAQEIADHLGDHDLRVAALNNLALAYSARHDVETAIGLNHEALELCTTMGDRHHEAALHNNLADLLHATGRSEEAMAHLKTAVEAFAEVGVDEEPRPAIWMLDRW